MQLSLSDVYTALQTGLVDTVAAPAMGAIALQWHTKLKYLTDVPLTFLTGAFVIERRVFLGLEAADQDVIRQEIRAAARRLDMANRDGEQNARQALRAQGVEFVMPPDSEEIDRWHDIARQALVALRRKGIYSKALIEELQGHLAEYLRTPSALRGE